MLSLNDIFQAEGLSPARVQLIRHKDARVRGRSLFDVWFGDREIFEEYQRIQRPRNAFEIGGLVASFVVTQTNETVFIGLYETSGQRKSRPEDIDPLLGHSLSGDYIIHEMQCKTTLGDYIGRLVIEPWKDAINFVQRAASRNPRVLEIKRAAQEELFPGLLAFSRKVSDLPGIFPNWRERLNEVKGIYLLTFEDGHQYVGSASGDKGFWQRWSDYVKDGHGGNRVLIRGNRDARHATVSILEFTGSSDQRFDIVNREMIWQAKLGARAKRLDKE